MHQINKNRYEYMQYRRCGKSGIKLPLISLGLWQNFGEEATVENQKKMIFKAFDSGITHFDLANNYGAPNKGAAEENFGRILRADLNSYRDEMIISTKAGYSMWPGPYGDFGSRKYLIASLDQSLKRMGLDYVDIFYHHRPDPDTPLEETMGALSDLVHQGKTLYIGLSNYGVSEAREAIRILKENRTPCLIHQPRYNMLERTAEKGLLELLEKEGTGCIPFSPLAQGVLSDKYVRGIPADSRASKSQIVRERYMSDEQIAQVLTLNEIALKRGQSLASMALCWVLRRKEVTSVLIGASKAEQIEDNLKALEFMDFTEEELKTIDRVLEN